MDPDTSVVTFRAIWIAPSIILGLGITRLLSDGISLFRSRDRARLDWIPVLWAVSIFLLQIQYVWAVIELPDYVPVWTLPKFLMLLGLSLLLFIAAALVLPDVQLKEGEDLAERFDHDGRWALGALSLWEALALLANWMLFDQTVISIYGAMSLILIVLPLLFLVGRNRILKACISIAYLILSVVFSWVLSPKSY